MPKVYNVQNSFTRGEISPRLLGRVDLEQFQNGCKTLLNFIPLPHGGLTRRGGTKYVDSSKDGSKYIRLVPFEFSTTQAYILEFGENYIRYYKDQAQIGNTTAITDATKANPCNIEQVAHGYATGDTIYIEGVGGMVEINDTLFTITKIDADNYTLGVDSSAYTTFTSAGTSLVQTTTTYTEAQVDDLQFAQSADVLYIAHPSHPPAKLQRTSHTTWTLADINFSGTGPFSTENSTATTLTPSGTSGSITITASAITGINSGTGFQSTDIGRAVTMTHSTTEGKAVITAVADTTHCTATVYTTLGGTGAVTAWTLGEWHSATDAGWPTCVTFFEQRLLWAANLAEPQRLWFSKSGEYENLTDGTDASDAMSYTISSDQVNKIQWLNPGKVLAVGTAGGEFVVSASAITEAITPTNIRIVRESTHGCDYQMSAMVGNAVLFIQRAKRKIHEFVFRFEQDAYSAPDLTILSEHITVGGIKELTLQQEPDSIVWAIRNDGTLLGLTYQREQNVVAWHKHVIGGTSDSGGTQAQVESIAVIPASDGSRDKLWVSVKRYVNSATVRHIEVMAAGMGETDGIEDSYYVDGGLVYSGAAATTITGLDHLEGETVSVLADGAVEPDETVASGSITIDNSATKVSVGYGFNSDLETLPIEAGSIDGAALGKIKRINEVGLKLYKTVGAQVGRDASNLDRIPFRSSADEMDEAVPLFTGNKFIKFNDGFERDANIYIRQDQPLPMTILAVMARVKTNN